MPFDFQQGFQVISIVVTKGGDVHCTGRYQHRQKPSWIFKLRGSKINQQSVKSSVPQGLIVGLMLFNIFLNKLDQSRPTSSLQMTPNQMKQSLYRKGSDAI